MNEMLDRLARIIRYSVDCSRQLDISEADSARLARAIIEAMHEPTKEMIESAYYAGSVGDNGGSERADFEDEWKAAIGCLLAGEVKLGLLSLIRPW